MAQIFDRRANTIAKTLLLVGLPLLLALASGAWWFYTRSDWVRDVNIPVTQPGGGYNHLLHVGGFKLDCRYCHNSVEISSSANIPPTETCMGCHSQVLTNSPKLAFLRDSYANDTPIQWNKVHNIPDFVYFNHSIHVNKGVGCATCHGRIDQMTVVYKAQPMYMVWCLECHREPEKFIRPKDQVFNMAWTPPADQLSQGLRLKDEYRIRDAIALTKCSICHR
ncbi:MAG: cytochrome c3 family protein [Roseiflexaceae bacterium]|nr:cytochrome c3 family protein [Roseiflexaceae bacterium]